MKLLILIIGLLSSTCFAQTQQSEATQAFYRQVQLLDSIGNYVERTDLARLMVIRKSLMTVIEDIENNVKTGKKEVTFQTLRLVQNLIVQYRYSQVLFGWTPTPAITSIYSQVIADDLKELQTLSENIVTEYGYDDSPYTQITANTFRQMQKLLQDIETLPIDAGLKKSLRGLWQPIGETIAVAELGDRPKTFEKAIPLIEQVRALYNQFDAITSTNAGFPMIMELQGLTEFYAEFAQMDSGI